MIRNHRKGELPLNGFWCIGFCDHGKMRFHENNAMLVAIVILQDITRNVTRQLELALMIKQFCPNINIQNGTSTFISRVFCLILSNQKIFHLMIFL